MYVALQQPLQVTVALAGKVGSVTATTAFNLLRQANNNKNKNASLIGAKNQSDFSGDGVVNSTPVVVTDERLTPLFALSCVLFAIISVGILGTWAIIVHTFFADCCRRRWRRYQRRRKIARRQQVQAQKQQMFYQAMMNEQRNFNNADAISSNSSNNNLAVPPNIAISAYNSQQYQTGTGAINRDQWPVPGGSVIGTMGENPPTNSLKPPFMTGPLTAMHSFLVNQASWTVDESDSEEEPFCEEEEMEKFRDVQHVPASRQSSYGEQANEAKRMASAISELVVGSLPMASSAVLVIAQQQQQSSSAPSTVALMSSTNALDMPLPEPPPAAPSRKRAPPLGRCVPTVTIEDYDETTSKGRQDYV